MMVPQATTDVGRGNNAARSERSLQSISMRGSAVDRRSSRRHERARAFPVKNA